MIEIGPIGREGERHRTGQLGERIALVPMALIPSPATMMATRGAFGRSGSGRTGCAKASAGRVPSAAIRGFAAARGFRKAQIGA